MKHQDLLFSKDESNKEIKVSSTAILFGSLRVNIIINLIS